MLIFCSWFRIDEKHKKSKRNFWKGEKNERNALFYNILFVSVIFINPYLQMKKEKKTQVFALFHRNGEMREKYCVLHVRLNSLQKEKPFNQLIEFISNNIYYLLCWYIEKRINWFESFSCNWINENCSFLVNIFAFLFSTSTMDFEPSKLKMKTEREKMNFNYLGF